MIIGSVTNTNASGGIPLPEGISRHSPFATKEAHHLSSDAIYMLKHPCFAMRAFEHVASNSFDYHIKKLKNRYGLEKIEHLIKGKDNDGGVVSHSLPEGFVATYWGLLSVICGTSLPQTFKQIKPNDNYPIGYTRLQTPATVFKGHVPVFNSINNFTELVHCLHYTIGQEIKKRFIYSLFPFIDQRDEITPNIYLNEDSKLEKGLLSVIQKKEFSTVELQWADLVSKFSQNLEASMTNNTSYFLETPDPFVKLYNDLVTQPDHLSMGKAISLINSQAYKPVPLEIVPENKIQLFLLPQTHSLERKQQNELAKKQEEIRKSIGDDAKNLQDISQLF